MKTLGIVSRNRCSWREIQLQNQNIIIQNYRNYYYYLSRLVLADASLPSAVGRLAAVGANPAKGEIKWNNRSSDFDLLVNLSSSSRKQLRQNNDPPSNNLFREPRSSYSHRRRQRKLFIKSLPPIRLFALGQVRSAGQFYPVSWR